MEICSLIARARAGDTALPAETLNLHGYATLAKRHLMHLLVGAAPNTRYLEVGTWEGATFMPALFGNPNASGVAVDSFVEFPGSRDHFERNLQALQLTARGRLVAQDCWTVNLQALQGPFTVYFFDGPHSVEDHARAFTYYDPVLADSFLAVVDDWLWPETQVGTRSAFAQLGYEVEWEWESGPLETAPEWGTGVYIARVHRRSTVCK